MGLRNDRVLFIPWNRDQSGSFSTEHDEDDRLSSHHKRKWKVICMDTPGKPLGDVGFGFGTRIHVVGHGSPGNPSLSADHGTGGASVSYTDLVDKMFEKGLKKYYIGTVACDVCSSALGDPCFAQLLARELWKRGVKASCVLGYKGTLFSVHNTYDGDGKKHKYKHRTVEIKDEDGDMISDLKSRDAQERFFGWL